MKKKRLMKKRFMNVKIDADVVRMAKVVAAAKCTTLTSYVSALLRSHVKKDMAEVASELIGHTALDALSTEICRPTIG